MKKNKLYAHTYSVWFDTQRLIDRAYCAIDNNINDIETGLEDIECGKDEDRKELVDEALTAIRELHELLEDADNKRSELYDIIVKLS